jgi:predicted DNA-binding transcriptional regulator AlpA
MNTTIDALLDRKEAAAFCKISERTLDRQINVPRVKLTARRIMYRQSDLLSWIAGKTATRANDNQAPTPDAA